MKLVKFIERLTRPQLEPPTREEIVKAVENLSITYVDASKLKVTVIDGEKLRNALSGVMDENGRPTYKCDST